MSPALGSIALSSIYVVIQASMVRSYSRSSSVLPRRCHGPAPVLSCELVARISVLFTSVKHVSEAARCEGPDRLSIDDRYQIGLSDSKFLTLHIMMPRSISTRSSRSCVREFVTEA